MVTNIKVEKIVVSSGVLGTRVYTPIDITSRVEMPILDTSQLDSVLDTTVLSYLSTISEPLKPLSRIKITITDTKNETTNTEYIYRLVENDLVENVVQGAKPIYRHTLSLIEITKQLERVIVDNLTFTNYLEDNYGTNNVIKFVSNTYILGGLAGWNNFFVQAHWSKFGYASGSNRFIGPYRMLYLSGYEKVEQGTDGALLVVANDTPTTDEDLEEGETIFDPNTQIKLEDVTPTQQNINIGDYVKYVDHTADNTISTNINMDIEVKYATLNFNAWIGWWHYKTLSLKEFTVSKPDGTSQTLSQNGTFTFTQNGTYTFRQYYCYKNENNVTMADAEFKWSITVVNSLALIPQEYTIKEVIERLLKVCVLRRDGIENQQYKLDENIASILDKKLSPEFNFTQGTLFEALQTIGEYIHAIPRLIPSVVYEYDTDSNGQTITNRNDYTNWDTITFDFLGGNDIYSKNNYSLIQKEHPLDEHANNFLSVVQNATQSNYSGKATVIEPFMGGFVSTRTESATFEISNNDCIFRTQKPIRSLISVKVYSKGTIKDIKTNIVEKSKYDILYSYTAPGDVYNNKAFFLYYTKGQKNIYALEYLRPNQNTLDTFVNDHAIRNILKLDESVNLETYIKDLSVQIEYIPFQDFKVKQYRVNYDTKEEDCSLFYNQQSNSVDVESYGESMKGAIMKTGNAKVIKTQYFEHLTDAPHVGVVTRDDYYAFVVNREIVTNTPIKVTTQWSYKYNELNAFTAVKKTIRQYEISEEESVNRNPDYQEFCLVDNDLDVATYIGDDVSADLKLYIKNTLSTLGFATNKMLNLLSNKLSNGNQTNKQITYAIVKTIGVNRAGAEETHCFLLPVSCFPFGNSIVLHFATDDNYSAATYAENPSNVNDKATNSLSLNSYCIEEFIKYSNEFGRFDKLAVIYGSDNPITDFDNNIVANSKHLYKVDENKINANSTLINYFTNPFNIDKDSREKIGLTVQLNFITSPTNQSIIGKALNFSLPIVGDAKTTYKMATFTKRPNKFEDVVEANTYQIIGNPSVTVNNDYKYIKIEPITALTKSIGYGIIDNNNRLVAYFDQELNVGSQSKPIYFMFRKY